MLYRISVTERGLTGIANIFRSRLSRLDDLLGAGTVPLMVLSLKRYCSTWAFRSAGIRETTLVTPLTRTNILFLSLSQSWTSTVSSSSPVSPACRSPGSCGGSRESQRSRRCSTLMPLNTDGYREVESLPEAKVKSLPDSARLCGYIGLTDCRTDSDVAHSCADDICVLA